MASNRPAVLGLQRHQWWMVAIVTCTCMRRSGISSICCRTTRVSNLSGVPNSNQVEPTTIALGFRSGKLIVPGGCCQRCQQQPPQVSADVLHNRDVHKLYSAPDECGCFERASGSEASCAMRAPKTRSHSLSAILGRGGSTHWGG